MRDLVNLADTPNLKGLAILLLAAVVLVRFPRALFIEAGSQKPSLRLEAALGLGFFLAGLTTFWVLGVDPWAKAALALVVMIAAAIAYSDLKFLVIPDLYSLALGALAFVAPWRLDWPQALLGAVLCGGLLGALALVWRLKMKIDGLGLGDVKLAAAAGALLGAQAGMLAIAVSAGGAAVLGLTLQKFTKTASAEAPLIPYGAALALTLAGFLVWRLS